MGEAMLSSRQPFSNIDYTTDWQYSQNTTHTIVTKYIGTNPDVTVPSIIDGKPVLLAQVSGSPANGPFYNNKNIKSVTFEQGVRFVNDNMYFAFGYCDLLEAVVGMPPATNMTRTFIWDNHLYNLPNIPNGITKLDGTFWGCPGTCCPTIPASVTDITDLHGCRDDLKSPPTIPSHVKIMNGTFQQSGITSPPVIPNGVTDINEICVMCYSLNSFPTIPSSVVNMSQAFYMSPNIAGSVTIPYGVQNIYGAFRDTNITSCYIPNSVTNVVGAFEVCTELTYVNQIPSNVTSISRMFAYCKNLSSTPAIPSGVTSITNAYSNTNIGSVPTLPSVLTHMNWAFSNCKRISGSVVIPNGVTNASGAFNGTNITSLTLANSLREIASIASNCANLTSVSGLAYTNTINMQSAFLNCYRLTTNIILPANVVNMFNAFYNCTNLPDMPTIPYKVTNMVYSFYNCTNIKNAKSIPASVTNATYCFYNCTNIACSSTLHVGTNTSSALASARSMYSFCTNLTGNINIWSKRIGNMEMQSMFYGTTLAKNVYIPTTGYNTTANTRNAAFNATYGINGKNGVTVYNTLT